MSLYYKTCFFLNMLLQLIICSYVWRYLCDSQGEMETLRERLDTIASTAGTSVDQAALAGSSALSALHTQHTSYAQTAQRASCPSLSRLLNAAPASTHSICSFASTLPRT